jgi:hypothetical protein
MREWGGPNNVLRLPRSKGPRGAARSFSKPEATNVDQLAVRIKAKRPDLG